MLNSLVPLLVHPMKKISLVLALMLAAGCTAPESATTALTGAGYTNIQLTGYRFFGCSEDDLFKTGFTAKGPTGQTVKGVVCGGIFKGSTIRLD